MPVDIRRSLTALIAFALVACAGSGEQLTGKVVSVRSDRLILQTDDHFMFLTLSSGELKLNKRIHKGDTITLLTRRGDKGSEVSAIRLKDGSTLPIQ